MESIRLALQQHQEGIAIIANGAYVDAGYNSDYWTSSPEPTQIMAFTVTL